MHDQIPMPPPRYTERGTLRDVLPDRCPAGHRHDDPDVRWLIVAPHGSVSTRVVCYACEPHRGREFAPTAELYDDLSWWYDPMQVAKRKFWAERRLRRLRS